MKFLNIFTAAVCDNVTIVVRKWPMVSQIIRTKMLRR